jgi:hypothetical protein
MNINGWNYDYDKLPYWDNRESIPWIYDFLVENQQQNRACLIYSVAEVGMGSYRGFLALFENKGNPYITLNITKYNFSGSKQCHQFNLNGDLFFTVPSMYYTEKNKLEFPILIIDCIENKFSYIRIINGIHYALKEINQFNFQLIDKNHDERFISRDGEVVDLRLLEWFDLSQIDNLVEMYYFESIE